MAKITSERIDQIMHEKVPNPVKLTTEYVQELGFFPDWADIDSFHWSYGNQLMTLTQEGLFPQDEPFVFSYHEGGTLKEVALEYEHQLKNILQFLLMNRPGKAIYENLNDHSDAEQWKTYTVTPLTGERAKSYDAIMKGQEWKEYKTETKENKKPWKTLSEPLSRDRITEILQKEVDNPKPLTGDFLKKEGLELKWAIKDEKLWSYPSDDLPYIPFILYETGSGNELIFYFHHVEETENIKEAFSGNLKVDTITVQYEHQLKEIIKPYMAKGIKQGQLSLFP